MSGLGIWRKGMARWAMQMIEAGGDALSISMRDVGSANALSCRAQERRILPPALD